MLTNEETEEIKKANSRASKINKQTKTRARIQRDYRDRLKKEGKMQITIIIDTEVHEKLIAFMESKMTNKGQFSKFQRETMSETTNRALVQFFRRR